MYGKIVKWKIGRYGAREEVDRKVESKGRVR